MIVELEQNDNVGEHNGSFGGGNDEVISIQL